MKRQILLSVLAAIAIFAVSTSAEAGMFGRLSHVLKCSPCEAACEVACDPCEAVCATPCEPCCDPCEVACDNGCGPCGKKPFRPFGGFFANMHARSKSCSPCCEVSCDPCCEVACDPCEVACCDTGCDTGCGPCGKKPFRPFNGFFANMFNSSSCNAGCNPCCEVSCDPCEPVCDPCASCCK